MGTLITTSIMITLLLTSSLFVLTATEAQQLYWGFPGGNTANADPVFHTASPPAADHAPHQDQYGGHPQYGFYPHYGAFAPADSAVVAERKKRQADPQPTNDQAVAEFNSQSLPPPADYYHQLDYINSLNLNPLNVQELQQVFKIS